MRRLRYSVPYIAGKNLPKDSDPAPCGAGPGERKARFGRSAFQSTRPLRGGTSARKSTSKSAGFQSTRPLRGGTKMITRISKWGTFQSTRPLRGGTGAPVGRDGARKISIHPPLAGRDASTPAPCRLMYYFNPPAPCGAGPSRGGGGRPPSLISIHPPLAGRDISIGTGTANTKNFNPPAPCGAGRAAGGPQPRADNFNPPAPCGAGPLYLRGRSWL